MSQSIVSRVSLPRGVKPSNRKVEPIKVLQHVGVSQISIYGVDRGSSILHVTDTGGNSTVIQPVDDMGDGAAE